MPNEPRDRRGSDKRRPEDTLLTGAMNGKEPRLHLGGGEDQFNNDKGAVEPRASGSVKAARPPADPREAEDIAAGVPLETQLWPGQLPKLAATSAAAE